MCNLVILLALFIILNSNSCIIYVLQNGYTDILGRGEGVPCTVKESE